VELSLKLLENIAAVELFHKSFDLEAQLRVADATCAIPPAAATPRTIRHQHQQMRQQLLVQRHCLLVRSF
jgi:hypothetical protein